MPYKGSEGKADSAASIGGIKLRLNDLMAFRKAQRGHEGHGSKDRRTPPPKTNNGSVPHDCGGICLFFRTPGIPAQFTYTAYVP
jgi:hypothetical protein